MFVTFSKFAFLFLINLPEDILKARKWECLTVLLTLHFQGDTIVDSTGEIGNSILGFTLPFHDSNKPLCISKRDLIGWIIGKKYFQVWKTTENTVIKNPILLMPVM